MPNAQAPRLLEVRHISKQFSGVRALDDVSLMLDRGEVLSICGENGAGKSTLMKIVAGVYAPSAGEILVDGQHVQFASVAQALAGALMAVVAKAGIQQRLARRDVGGTLAADHERSGSPIRRSRRRAKSGHGTSVPSPRRRA